MVEKIVLSSCVSSLWVFPFEGEKLRPPSGGALHIVSHQKSSEYPASLPVCLNPMISYWKPHIHTYHTHLHTLQSSYTHSNLLIYHAILTHTTQFLHTILFLYSYCNLLTHYTSFPVCLNYLISFWNICKGFSFPAWRSMSRSQSQHLICLLKFIQTVMQMSGPASTLLD